MKQDKAEKIIQKAERKAQKAAQQVQVASKKAEAAAKKQAMQAEKKAAKVANAADKKAAKQSKKADQAAKKAQIAARKAEEKKAKAVAKAAARATAAGEGAEDGGKPKKKGKKKLLILVAVVLAAAVGAGAFFFLKGRGGDEEDAPPEPIELPFEYVLNEVKIAALPVWGSEVLVYQEEIPPEPPAEPENAGEGEEGEESGGDAEETEDFTKILYRYEGLKAPGELVSAYMAVMTTEDGGFSVVDETLLKIDPPELSETSGSVQIARNVPEDSGGGVQSMLLSWDETTCTVTLDMPEGRVREPQPERPAGSMTPSRGLSDLEAIDPAKLGLPGDSMEDYELMVQDGSVRIANSPCMQVNVYGGDNQIAGIYFISSGGLLYKLDEAAGGVVQLQWE